MEPRQFRALSSHQSQFWFFTTCGNTISPRFNESIFNGTISTISTISYFKSRSSGNHALFHVGNSLSGSDIVANYRYSATRVYIAQAQETPEDVDHSTDDSVTVVNSSVAPIIRDDGMYLELCNGLGMLNVITEGHMSTIRCMPILKNITKSPPAPLPPIFLINFNIEESPHTLE